MSGHEILLMIGLATSVLIYLWHVILLGPDEPRTSLLGRDR